MSSFPEDTTPAEGAPTFESQCDACHGTGILQPPVPASRARRSASPVGAHRGRRSSAPERTTYSSYSSAWPTRQYYEQLSSGLPASAPVNAGTHGYGFPTSTARVEQWLRSEQPSQKSQALGALNERNTSSIAPGSAQHHGRQPQTKVDVTSSRDRSTPYMQSDPGKSADNGRSDQAHLAARGWRDTHNAADHSSITPGVALAAPIPVARAAPRMPHVQAQIQGQSTTPTSRSSNSSEATLPLFLTSTTDNNAANSRTLNHSTRIDDAGSGSSGVANRGSNTISNGNSNSNSNPYINSNANSTINSNANSTSNSNANSTLNGISKSDSNSNSFHTATSRESAGGVGISKVITGSKPKLPPIKQLLDDIDDWPQARASRASSIRSSGGSPVLDGVLNTTMATKMTSHESPNVVYTPGGSPILSQSSVFARPNIIPARGNSTFTSIQQAPFRSSHLRDGEFGVAESSATDSSCSTSIFPLESGSTAASIASSLGQQWTRKRDEQASPKAKKRPKVESRSPRDRMSTLSLDPQPKPNDVHKPFRPSFAARLARPDKYRSYFADAAVNSGDLLEDYSNNGAFSSNDARAQTLLGEDNVIITPPLEATRGDELEAAIHLAGIASSGANSRPRGNLERFYVTTTAASPSFEDHRPHQPTFENSQKNDRALKAMGSLSDQASSYGTAPSLMTDASTFAGSTHGGALSGSPPYSLGPSPDENAEMSSATTPSVHQQRNDTPVTTSQQSQQQQQRQQQQRQQQSEHQPQADTDGNGSSNGTGKYFCAVCQKRFSRPSALAVHSHMHTGAKPFACQICDRSFSVNSNLRRHMKTHSRDEMIAAGQ